jgi:hypothetical protein
MFRQQKFPFSLKQKIWIKMIKTLQKIKTERTGGFSAFQLFSFSKGFHWQTVRFRVFICELHRDENLFEKKMTELNWNEMNVRQFKTQNKGEREMAIMRAGDRQKERQKCRWTNYRSICEYKKTNKERGRKI